MSDLLHPYDYKEQDKFYEFTTARGIVYVAYFLAMAEYGPAFTNVYTFNFEPRTKVDDAPHDERIADTICSIIERIFVNDRNAVIIVCDNTDHHEQGRNRLFQQWYARLNNKSLSKVDKQYQSEDYDIYSSLLIHLDNPDLEEITFAFNQLAETGFIPEED